MLPKRARLALWQHPNGTILGLLAAPLPLLGCLNLGLKAVAKKSPASTVRTVRAVTTQSPATARAWVRPRDPILHARLAPHPPRPQDFDACRRMPLATALAIHLARFLNPTDPGAGPCTMLGAGIQRLTPAPASGAARPCRGGGPSVAGRGNCSFPRDTGPVHPPGPVSLGNGGFLYSATDPAGPAGCERTDTGQGQLPGLPTSK